MSLLSLRPLVVMSVALLALTASLPAIRAQSCGYNSFNFASLNTYDIYGADGSAGSNEDSLYIVRVCGAVADPVCSAQGSGTMACQHAWPNYQSVPNGGTVSPPSSAYCANDVHQLAPAFSTLTGSSAPVWTAATVNSVTGAMMTVSSGTCSGSTPYVTNIVFLCAPLQTTPLNFASVTSSGSCNFTFTLYTSLACTSAQLAAPPTALAAPPAASSSNCGYGGVSFASLSVDINATDDAGRLYVVHPCGSVTSTSTQFCGYPANSGQQPSSYPSACEVTGYCNPFYAAESFAYFNPSASDFTWYPLSNGFAYSQSTPLSDEGWTSDQQGCPNGALSTFTFICNASATTVALTQSTARVFNYPTQCGYVVQLQTSLACSGTSSYLPSPTTSFGGMGYDLSSLTGYDIYAAQSGVYNGQFSQISFCISMFNASSPSWVYSARGVAVVAYTLSAGTTIQNPTGQFVVLYFSSGVLSTNAAGVADVNVSLLQLNSDGSDNLLNVVAGSNVASPDGGGVTVGWTTASGRVLGANLYDTPAQIDSGYPIPGTWSSGTFTFTAQYYDPNNPTLISCDTTSQPIVQASSQADAIQTAPDYYYLNLGGVVKDPTCAANTGGGMVCQRWGPTNCSRTEVGAVWQPSVLIPSWTYVNGRNYSAGIQLSMWATNPLFVQQQSGAIGCYGLTVRIQFVCSTTTLRPYVATGLVQSSSSNFACAWTIVIPTYLLCTPPGQSSLPAPPATSCIAPVNGKNYDLSSLSTVDISAYDSSNTQYVYRACGAVANAWCQGTIGTYKSQFCAVPQACTQSSSTILLSSIAGAYSANAVTWSAISGGISLKQSTGDQCTATCGGQTLYSGPRQSIVNFMCSSSQSGAAATATVTPGSYDSSCNAVNGGTCTTTMTVQTSTVCSTATGGSAGGSTLSVAALAAVLIGWAVSSALLRL